MVASSRARRRPAVPYCWRRWCRYWWSSCYCTMSSRTWRRVAWSCWTCRWRWSVAWLSYGLLPARSVSRRLSVSFPCLVSLPETVCCWSATIRICGEREWDCVSPWYKVPLTVWTRSWWRRWVPPWRWSRWRWMAIFPEMRSRARWRRWSWVVY